MSILTDSSQDPKLGQMVFITQGSDAGRYGVILNVLDERFVLVADGLKRKFDRPKKKNIIHLELQNKICEEIVESLRETGRVTNKKLRVCVQRFVEKLKNVDGQ